MLVLQARKAKIDYFISSVASNANDVLNTGTSATAPWATIAPLLVLGAVTGALNGKVIAFERGGQYTPMDLATITADDCTVTDYGNSAANRPFFDLFNPLDGVWTLDSAGIYKMTLSRQANSKNRGNYRRNAWPMRKVESKAALAGKPVNTVFVDLETGSAPVLYMNSAVDPSTDGAIYDYSKFSIAISLNGSRNKINGIWTRGNAGQDGGLRLGGGIGGNTLSGCRVDWGSRHSAYIASGILTSYCLSNEFYGGANEIEDGNILSAGAANAVVFNSPDHSMATCISQGNVYNGMGRNNPISGARSNFTGPYGHDGVAGRPMLRFESVGDVYIDMAQGPGVCGQVNVFANPTFTRCIEGMSINAANISMEMYGASSGSAIDRLFANLVNAGVTCYLHDCPLINIPDCGAGGAGWVLAGTGSTAVTNMRVEDCSFNISGMRTANTNRFFLSIRAGNLTFKRNKVGPNLAPPVSLMFNLGAAVTVDASNDGNFWANGVNFSKGGTTYYGLQAWQTATGTEATSVYLGVPTAEFTEDFNGADASLDAVPGWSRLNGVSTDLQRKSGRLYNNSVSGTPTAYPRGDLSSDDQYTRFVLRNTGSAGGAALRLVDASNLMFVRATGAAVALMKTVAGTTTQSTATSGITPALNNVILVVIRWHLDPVLLTYSMRASIVIDGALGIGFQDVTISGFEQERTCGAVSRAVQTDLLDDLTFGPAPLLLAA